MEVWLLIAYSAQGNCKLQEIGLYGHRHLSTVSMDWLARSVWPLVWGWKPDDKLTEVPMSVQNAFQNLAEHLNNVSGNLVKSNNVSD